MSTTTNRKIAVTFDGDAGSMSKAWLAAENVAAPASIQPVELLTGNNTITVPVTATPGAVTIIKPSDNAETITFKGVNGDTGVKLHLTDPDSISLHGTIASFVLNVTGTIDVILVWS